MRLKTDKSEIWGNYTVFASKAKIDIFCNVFERRGPEVAGARVKKIFIKKNGEVLLLQPRVHIISLDILFCFLFFIHTRFTFQFKSI